VNVAGEAQVGACLHRGRRFIVVGGSRCDVNSIQRQINDFASIDKKNGSSCAFETI
jgi:tRNA A37 N6-isopentenylltransferase MiaA